ncbi:MAG: hypothetical protein E7539_06305 [Ruminococcaceae bacterium]|nr:hypothetical protein [Oscillospiraceae bacterium]
MKQLMPKELEDLLHEYNNANSMTDIQIKEKLEKIIDCYTECTSEERAFTDAITVLFCRTIGLLRKQLSADRAAADIPRDPDDQSDHNFLSYHTDLYYNDVPFADGNALRIAFYNYFRNKKKKNGIELVEYPEIQSLDELKGESVNSTMRDYVARIQTFANGYLMEIPRIAEIWHREINNTPIDPILFTYKHLELILASFETKEYSLTGEKVLNKQKNNIRSALRKLNEFKREVEAR